MKFKVKRSLIALLALVLGCCMVFAGCKDDDEGGGDTPPPAETKVALSPVAATLIAGNEITIAAEVTGPDAELSWSSSKKLVASVVGNGKTAVVKAHTPGSATIRVKVDGELKATCEITVEKEPDKLEINLPMKKLVLRQTGDKATVKAKIVHPAVSEDSIAWAIDSQDVATIKTQGLIASVTAVSAGTTELTVTGKAGAENVEASIEVTVLETMESAVRMNYYAFKPDGTKSTEEFVGLANAVNVITNNPDYGEGSYIATTEDPDTKVYTYTKKNYSFFTRSGVYHGFDKDSHVDNGQANFWQDFYKKENLDLFSNTNVNMLQHNGTVQNTWYYRKSNFVYRNGEVNDGWQGYRDSVYTAAGAGANYATWSDDKANDMTDLELNYDLSDSYMLPSESSQPVFAEIYMRPIVNDSGADKTKYYGAYFDAGTVASTAELADGAKGYWYGYEGKMSYIKTDGIVYPNPSILTLNTDEPIGYSTWNKAAGRWETADLKIKLSLEYHFSDENEGAPFAVDYAISGTQGGETKTASYTYALGKTFDRSYVRFTYGVSFTPKAKTSDTEQWEGFYKNVEVPDIYNGGAWQGVKQGKCVYRKTDATEGSLAFIGTGTRQYVSIWGSDVCSYKNDGANGITTFNFQF